MRRNTAKSFSIQCNGYQVKPSLAIATAIAVICIALISAKNSTSRKTGLAIFDHTVDKLAINLDVNEEKESPIRVTDDLAIAISLVQGKCKWISGPISDYKRSEAETCEQAVSLGLWEAPTNHLLCMPFLCSNVTQEPIRTANMEENLVASVHSNKQSEKGVYGFGEGVEVKLCPKLATKAFWPLQAGVESLDVNVDASEAARALGLYVSSHGQVQSSLPVVVARPRRSDWPIDVQFLSTDIGICTAGSKPGVKHIECRLKSNVKDVKRHLLFLCGPCFAHTNGEVLVQIPKDRSGGLLLESDLSFTTAWQAIPVQPRRFAWIFDVMVSLNGKVDKYKVAVAMGDSIIPWEDMSPESGLDISCWFLCKVADVTVILAFIVFLLGQCGLPVPIAALHPSASAASLALQFAAFVSGAEVPSSVSRLQRAWFSAANDPSLISKVAVLITIIVFFHALAVLRHIRSNGKGSAEAMPHGLSFGSWELRILPFVTFPLSAHAFTELLNFDLSRLLALLLSASFIALLIITSFATLQRCWRWFEDELVISIEDPGTRHLYFLDRVSDQINSMPIYPVSNSKCFCSWTRSPTWSLSRPVATIFDVEHRGRSKLSSWNSPWPIEGPWHGHTNLLREASSPRLSVDRSISNGSLRNRSKLIHRIASVDSSTDLIQRDFQESKSLFLSSHHVSVTTRFKFSALDSTSIAGALGTKWLDVAVPSQVLTSLQLQNVELAVQASQLSGPLTGGRFAACFDSGDRYPFRWPLDLLVRVVLGLIATLLPSVRTGSAGLFSVLLLGTLSVITFGVTLARLHHHFLDNCAVTSAGFSVLISTALVLKGAELPPYLLSAFSSLLISLLFVPVLLTFFASGLMIWSALCCRRSNTDHHKVLQSFCPGWGNVPGNSRPRRPVVDDYFNLDQDDDYVDTADTLYSQAVDVVLLPSPILVKQFPKKAIRLYLPGTVHTQITYAQLWTKGAAAFSTIRPTGANSTSLPQLALPSGMLFEVPGTLRSSEDAANVTPLATILTPDDGFILYSDPARNGGFDWQEALYRFFGDEHPSLGREAEKILKFHQEQQAEIEDVSQRSLMVVEVKRSYL